MTSEVLILIKDVSFEALKILGPAIVAGFLAYKIARIQIEIRIKEIEKQHSFNAKEHYFNYYQQRLDKLEEQSKSINNSIAKAFESLAIVNIIDEPGSSHLNKSEPSNFASKIFTNNFEPGIAATRSLLPAEIKMTLLELEKLNLTSADEYKQIITLEKQFLAIEPPNTIVEYSDFFSLIKLLYLWLIKGSQLVLETRIENIFKENTP